jgi:anaerobic selenocysteine-containing dehydrogenase
MNGSASRQGTDGLFILALVHELLRTGKIDLDYLVRYTNAPWLVIDDPDAHRSRAFCARRRGRAACPDRRAANRRRPQRTPGREAGAQGPVRRCRTGASRPGLRTAGAKYLDRNTHPPQSLSAPGIEAAPSRRSPAKSPIRPSSAKW